jgi:quinol monooxygenase YgiN
MLFELRKYQALPGRRDDLVRIMENDIIPFQAAKGVVVVGSFVDEENPDTYVWIRRFNDEEHRKALYAAVYQSDYMLDRSTIEVTRLVPTSTSVIR